MRRTVVSVLSSCLLLATLPPIFSKNLLAIPRTARIQCTSKPTDPQRKFEPMPQAEDGVRVRGRRLDDAAVLRYLRRMIRYCREQNHQEMRWYYEAALQFAAVKIYGPLPPLPDRGSNIPNAGQPPSEIVTPLPAGWTRPVFFQMPLRTIAKRFTRLYRGNEYSFETLECAHILLTPPGYSVPAKSRRCIHCGIEAMAKKKKPVGRSADLKSKAVTA